MWSYVDSETALQQTTSVEKVDLNGDGVEMRATKLRDLLVRAWSDTAVFHQGLHADGRELTEEEASAARVRLQDGAVCLLRVGRERGLIDALATTGRTDIDLGGSLMLLRMLQHTLVMASSDQADRRARTVSPERLANTLLPVCPHWQSLEHRHAAAACRFNSTAARRGNVILWRLSG